MSDTQKPATSKRPIGTWPLDGIHRWYDLEDIWGYLTSVQQTDLIETARAMLAPVPQSLRA